MSKRGVGKKREQSVRWRERTRADPDRKAILLARRRRYRGCKRRGLQSTKNSNTYDRVVAERDQLCSQNRILEIENARLRSELVVVKRDRLRSRNRILEFENARLCSAQRETVCDNNTESCRADIATRLATAMRPRSENLQSSIGLAPSQRASLTKQIDATPVIVDTEYDPQTSHPDTAGTTCMCLSLPFEWRSFKNAQSVQVWQCDNCRQQWKW